MLRFSYRRALLYLVAILGGVGVWSGCGNTPEEIREFSITDDFPALTVDTLHVLYTEEGKLLAEVKAPAMRNMTRQGGNFDEFPQGILVLAYDAEGNINSTIKANYAIYHRDEKLWDARYRVLAVNEQHDSIQSEQIFWNEKAKRVYTSANVKVTTDDATLFGRGFESDDRFENWEIKEPTGIIAVEHPQ